MTKRERIMAMAVGALAPIVLLFWGVSSIGGGLQKKTDEINRLQSQVTQLGTQQRNARFAMARLANYRSESLPADTKISSDCRTWLEKTATDEFELDSVTVSVPTSTVLNASLGQSEKQLAMRTYSYDVKGLGTPRQITGFLYRLNESSLLHRSTLTLNPEKGKAGRGKITGRWRMTLKVEVASLPDAERETDYKVDTRPFSDRTVDDYHNVVSRRNLFGPVSERPKFASESKFEFEPGDRMKIALEVEEADRGLDYFDPSKFDFSLEGSDIEGLELVQKEEGSREAELKVPDDLPEGRYSATVKTIDKGSWPYKEQTERISIVVAEPEAEEGPPPARLIAKDTFLTTLKTKDGVTRVTINIAPMGERLKLAVGESFELDGKEWTVKAIDKPIVTFLRDNQLVKFRMGGNLFTPIEARDDVTKR